MNLTLRLWIHACFAAVLAASSFDHRTKLGQEAFVKGDFATASEHFEAAKELAAGALDKRAIATANLASLHFSTGKVAAAVQEYKEALRDWEATGRQSRGFRTTLRNLADSFGQLGEFDQAAELLKRLESLLQADAKPDADGVSRMRLSMAKLKDAMGQSVEAEELYRALLADSPADAVLRASALDGLGEVQLKLGKIEDAEGAFTEALGIWEMVGYKVRAASTANRLGDRWLNARKPKLAIPYLRRALVVFEEEGIAGAQLASTLNNLGQACRFAGNEKSAAEYFQRALSTAERDLGTEHPILAAVRINIGDLALSRKKYDEAEVHLMGALAMDERRLGRSHPDIARDLSRLAMLHLMKKEYEIASKELADALAIHERCQAPFTLQQAVWLEWRAELLRKKENYAEAAKLEVKAMGIRVKHTIR